MHSRCQANSRFCSFERSNSLDSCARMAIVLSSRLMAIFCFSRSHSRRRLALELFARRGRAFLGTNKRAPKFVSDFSRVVFATSKTNTNTTSSPFVSNENSSSFGYARARQQQICSDVSARCSQTSSNAGQLVYLLIGAVRDCWLVVVV